jgi:hypothetical protein
VLYVIGSFHQFRSDTHQEQHGAVVRLPLGAEAILRNFAYTARPGFAAGRP